MNRWDEFCFHVFKPSTLKGQKIQLEIMILLVLSSLFFLAFAQWAETPQQFWGTVNLAMGIGIFMEVRVWNLLGYHEQELLDNRITPEAHKRSVNLAFFLVFQAETLIAQAVNLFCPSDLNLQSRALYGLMWLLIFLNSVFKMMTIIKQRREETEPT